MGADGLRARLERLASSAIADARGKAGALPPAISRLSGTGTVAGPAVTARCGEASVAAVLRALADADPGSVLVVPGPGGWAYFGELTGAEAVRVGLAALVVDGYVRDFERLAKLPLPIFARGLTPQGAAPAGAGEAHVALEIAGT